MCDFVILCETKASETNVELRPLSGLWRIYVTEAADERKTT